MFSHEEDFDGPHMHSDGFVNRRLQVLGREAPPTQLIKVSNDKENTKQTIVDVIHMWFYP